MTHSTHGAAPATSEEAQQVLASFLSEIRKTPITFIDADTAGKPIVSISSLGKSPYPLMKVIKASMRDAFAEPPLSACSAPVMHMLLKRAESLLSYCLSDISHNNEFNSAQAKQLQTRIRDDFAPPHGIFFRDLSLYAGLLSAAHDPIDIGMVSFPTQYDDIMLELYKDKEDDPKSAIKSAHRQDVSVEEVPDDNDFDDLQDREADISMSWQDYIQDDPMTLHPLVETRMRLSAMLTEVKKHRNALFYIDIDPAASLRKLDQAVVRHTPGSSPVVVDLEPLHLVNSSEVDQKIGLLESFAQRLLTDIKRQTTKSRKAFLNPTTELPPSSYANLFLHAIEMARDVATSPQELKNALAKNSPLLGELMAQEQSFLTPETRVQTPARHIKTIAGAKAQELENPGTMLMQ